MKVSLNELEKASNATQAPKQGNYIPPNQDDFLGRFDKIIGNINYLLENVIKMRGDTGANGQAPNLLPNDSLAQSNPPPAERAKPIIPIEIQNYIGIVIESCLKENPEMKFIDVLGKVDLTAAGLAVIYNNLRGLNKQKNE